MEKNITNPWKWQDALGYSQAVEVKNVESVLYVAGQAAMDEEGKPSTADMRTQMELVFKNLETVIKQSGYACKNIVRLNIYTTSTDEVWKHFETFKTWMQEQDMKPAVTMLQVVGPEKFELEATAVK